MTEQTVENTDPNTPEHWAAMRRRLDQQQRESIERASKVQAAWSSWEAEVVREVVRADGNVDWREFVSHAGGIMRVCELVDAEGRADTTRIIPLVDELFGKTAVTEYKGGMTVTRQPRNRPYHHSRALLASREVDQRAAFPGDGDPRQCDVEALLRQQQEEAMRTPRTARR